VEGQNRSLLQGALQMALVTTMKVISYYNFPRIFLITYTVRHDVNASIATSKGSVWKTPTTETWPLGLPVGGLPTVGCVNRWLSYLARRISTQLLRCNYICKRLVHCWESIIAHSSCMRMNKRSGPHRRPSSGALKSLDLDRGLWLECVANWA